MSCSIKCAGVFVALNLAIGFAEVSLAQQQGGGTTGGGSAAGLTTSFGTAQSAGVGTGQPTTGFGAGYGALLNAAQGGAGGTNQLGANSRTSLTQSLSAQRNNQQLLQQNQQNLQNLVPIRLQVASAFAQVSTGSYPAPEVQGRLQRVVANSGLGAPVAMWEGATLVLSGPVANARVRSQIEGVALLSPGVRTVRNEMVIGPVQ